MPLIVGVDTYIARTDIRFLDTSYEAAFGTSRQDECIARAFSEVNATVVQKVPIPVPPQADGSYDGYLKTWQTAIALYYLYLGNAPDKAEAFRMMVWAEDGISGIGDRFLSGKWLLGRQVSGAEKGIQQAVADSGNSGSGIVYANTRDIFYGDRYMVFEVEITTAGAVATAVYKWRINGGIADYTESVTTSVTEVGLDYGVNVYFIGADSDSFLVGDKYTITCIPEIESTQGMGPSSGAMIR